jgi:hypothetical protein
MTSLMSRSNSQYLFFCENHPPFEDTTLSFIQNRARQLASDKHGLGCSGVPSKDLVLCRRTRQPLLKSTDLPKKKTSQKNLQDSAAGKLTLLFQSSVFLPVSTCVEQLMCAADLAIVVKSKRLIEC